MIRSTMISLAALALMAMPATAQTESGCCLTKAKAAVTKAIANADKSECETLCTDTKSSSGQVVKAKKRHGFPLGDRAVSAPAPKRVVVLSSSTLARNAATRAKALAPDADTCHSSAAANSVAKATTVGSGCCATKAAQKIAKAPKAVTSCSETAGPQAPANRVASMPAKLEAKAADQACASTAKVAKSCCLSQKAGQVAQAAGANVPAANVVPVMTPVKAQPKADCAGTKCDTEAAATKACCSTKKAGTVVMKATGSTPVANAPAANVVAAPKAAPGKAATSSCATMSAAKATTKAKAATGCCASKAAGKVVQTSGANVPAANVVPVMTPVKAQPKADCAGTKCDTEAAATKACCSTKKAGTVVMKATGATPVANAPAANVVAAPKAAPGKAATSSCATMSTTKATTKAKAATGCCASKAAGKVVQTSGANVPAANVVPVMTPVKAQPKADCAGTKCDTEAAATKACCSTKKAGTVVMKATGSTPVGNAPAANVVAAPKAAPAKAATSSCATKATTKAKAATGCCASKAAGKVVQTSGANVPAANIVKKATTSKTEKSSCSSGESAAKKEACGSESSCGSKAKVADQNPIG